MCVVWRNVCWLGNGQVCRLGGFEVGGEKGRKIVWCGKECGLEVRGEGGAAGCGALFTSEQRIIQWGKRAPACSLMEPTPISNGLHPMADKVGWAHGYQRACQAGWVDCRVRLVGPGWANIERRGFPQPSHDPMPAPQGYGQAPEVHIYLALDVSDPVYGGLNVPTSGPI